MTIALDRAVHVKLAQMWVARLKTARKDQGVTQKQLGARIGVGKSLIRNWECGIHLPSVPSLMAWAEALGFDLQLVPTQPEGD